MTDAVTFSAKQWLARNTRQHLIFFAVVLTVNTGLQVFWHASERTGSGVFSYLTVEVALSAWLNSTIALFAVAGYGLLRRHRPLGRR